METLQRHTLLAVTATSPGALAVRDRSRTLDWATLESRARRFAHGLRRHGLGDVGSWAMLAPNRAEWAETSLGNVRAGTRSVPLNWHLTPGELAAMLDNADVRLLIVDPMHADRARLAAQESNARTGQRTTILTLGDEYEHWLDEQPDDPLPAGPTGIILQYTGGTTGPSRAVLRSDAQGPADAFVARQSVWADLTGMPLTGHGLLVTPAYHALGGAILRSCLARGVPVTMLDTFDPCGVLEAIETYAITTTAMVPTQFIRLLKLPADVRGQFDVSSVRWILHTAAPCPAWVKSAMIEWFGPVIVELFGSSEGLGPVIGTSREWLDRPGTVGRAVGSLELSIVDDQGHDLPAGAVGHIYGRRADGPPSYHGDDDKTRAMVLPDGRFTVGDIGWLDEDGFLFLADRRVDLVIRGGTNIYPAEIEAVLSEHPRVLDVAVFGVPDPEWGQQIVALVEPVAGSDTGGAGSPPLEQVLADHCRERLASFKVPGVIEVVETLPREASGKLKKQSVRESYLARA